MGQKRLGFSHLGFDVRARESLGQAGSDGTPHVVLGAQEPRRYPTSRFLGKCSMVMSLALQGSQKSSMVLSLELQGSQKMFHGSVLSIAGVVSFC